MQTLTKEDLRFVVSRIPRDVREMMIKYNLTIAGGFIRSTIAGEKPSDIDLFGETVEMLDNAANWIAANRRARIHKTDNAITILTPSRIPLQLITRWLYKEIGPLVESFDFTIAQAAIGVIVNEDGKSVSWTSFISDSFYPDLAARRLVYTFPVRNEDAGGSLLRVRKFLSKGYTIQAPALAGTIARLISRLKWDESFNYHMKNNMIDEVWLSQVITGLLREVDPLTIIDGIDIIDEHSIIEEVINEEG